jgi:hypothetical protein
MVTASLLAGRYDAYLTALHRSLAQPRWSGLGPLQTFMAWIEGCWRDEALPEPDGPPTAVSVGGWGEVRWHETADGLRGYVPGLPGCYEVSAGDAPPPLRPTHRARVTPIHARPAIGDRLG